MAAGVGSTMTLNVSNTKPQHTSDLHTGPLPHPSPSNPIAEFANTINSPGDFYDPWWQGSDPSVDYRLEDTPQSFAPGNMRYPGDMIDDDPDHGLP
jgi:hypothetical protein